jgi:hypothetical protein
MYLVLAQKSLLSSCYRGKKQNNCNREKGKSNLYVVGGYKRLAEMMKHLLAGKL